MYISVKKWIKLLRSCKKIINNKAWWVLKPWFKLVTEFEIRIVSWKAKKLKSRWRDENKEIDICIWHIFRYFTFSFFFCKIEAKSKQTRSKNDEIVVMSVWIRCRRFWSEITGNGGGGKRDSTKESGEEASRRVLNTGAITILMLPWFASSYLIISLFL